MRPWPSQSFGEVSLSARVRSEVPIARHCNDMSMPCRRKLMRQKLHHQLLLRCSFSYHGLPANKAEFEPDVFPTITTLQRFRFERAHSLCAKCDGRYTWPRSNWRPSTCGADVIATDHKCPSVFATCKQYVPTRLRRRGVLRNTSRARADIWSGSGLRQSASLVSR